MSAVVVRVSVGGGGRRRSGCRAVHARAIRIATSIDLAPDHVRIVLRDRETTIDQHTIVASHVMRGHPPARITRRRKKRAAFYGGQRILSRCKFLSLRRISLNSCTS